MVSHLNGRTLSATPAITEDQTILASQRRGAHKTVTKLLSEPKGNTPWECDNPGLC